MTVQEYQNRKTKKLLNILGKQKLPDKHVRRNLYAIRSSVIDSGTPLVAIYAYLYGYMQGKKAQRDVRKWNKLAIFCNMKEYASSHEGKLPETLQQLQEWVGRERG